MNHVKILIIAAAALGIYLYLQPPSTAKVVRDTSIDTQEGTLRYQGNDYQAQWGEATEHAGDVRYTGRAYWKYAPFFTHDIILTTGEFSDPEIVEIAPVKDGNTRWRANKRPEGSFLVLHLIPANPEVLAGLDAIREGEPVKLLGQEEKDSRITGSDGSVTRLTHDNHRFLLVTGIE